jgi:hypothetical protein
LVGIIKSRLPLFVIPNEGEESFLFAFLLLHFAFVKISPHFARRNDRGGGVRYA